MKYNQIDKLTEYYNLINLYVLGSTFLKKKSLRIKKIAYYFNR